MKALNSPHTAKHAGWMYAEQHRGEDPVLEAARARGEDLGVRPVSEGAAATLTVLAASSNARALVEVGTGVGVSGVSLLRGAAAQAVLTSIDPDPEHLQAARQAFVDDGVPASRTRLITGDAAVVLRRLTTSGYDLVLLDAGTPDVPVYVSEALRMLHSGGMLIINDALDHDRVPRPAVREESTRMMREVERTLRDDERLVTTMLGTGTGLLVAVVR